MPIIMFDGDPMDFRTPLSGKMYPVLRLSAGARLAGYCASTSPHSAVLCRRPTDSDFLACCGQTFTLQR